MSEVSGTPETDAEVKKIPSPPYTIHIQQLANFARRLERDRDAIIKAHDSVMSQAREALNVRDQLRARIAELESLNSMNAEVMAAALKFWSDKRPAAFSEKEHLENPAINCSTESEKALCEAVAAREIAQTTLSRNKIK